MEDSIFDDNDNSSANLSENNETLPDGLWSTQTLRSKAQPLFFTRLQHKLVKVPSDGESLIHSITRSLGLSPPNQWHGTMVWEWARLFRFHLARHLSDANDPASLYSENTLEDRFAVLLARLWHLRLTVHPVQEWPPREIHFAPSQFFPLQELNDLLDIQLVLYSDRKHFEFLVPPLRNFYAHQCTITARDWRIFFTSDNAGESRFDRFIFQWLQILKVPNPNAADGVYKFNSVSKFMSSFAESSWPELPYLDAPLVHDGSIFVHNNVEVPHSIQDAKGGIEDGLSSNSTVDSINDTAPPSEGNSIDRYKNFVCLFLMCVLHVYRYVWV